MPHRVIIAHPSYADEIRSRTQCRWVYVGRTVEVCARLEELFGSGARALSAADFYREALGGRAAFLKWVDHVVPITSPTEKIVQAHLKNPFSTDLFLEFIWTILLPKLIEEDLPLAIFTESRGFARFLEAEARKMGNVPTLRMGLHGFLGELLWWLKAWMRVVYQSISLLMLGLLGKLMLSARFWEGARSATILIDNYLTERSFSGEGMFQDRYFPNLALWYSSRGLSFAYVTTFFGVPWKRTLATFRAVRASEVKILPIEGLIAVSDVIFAVRAAVTMWCRPVRLPDLATRHWRYASLISTYLFGLNRGMSHLLAKTTAAEFFLSWFENSSRDRAVALSAMDRGLTVVAARQFVLFPLWPSLFATTNEVVHGAVPATNWVAGATLQRGLQAFDSIGSYEVVPALRYQYLFQLQPASLKRAGVAVFLSHSREESLAVLRLVAEVWNSPVSASLPLLLKCHPNLKREDFGLARFAWAQSLDKASWVNEVAPAIFAKVNLLVGVGSGVLLEAVCAGVPVAVVGASCGLTMNPLEGIDSQMWRIAFDAADLGSAIREWGHSHPLPELARQTLGRKICEQFFEKTTDDGVLRLMPQVSMH